MVVGCLELVLIVGGAQSLKDKRRVLRRGIDRVRGKFNVSIAEVGDNDLLQRARIGFSAVANDTSFVNEVLDKARNHLEDATAGEAEVVDARLELFHL